VQLGSAFGEISVTCGVFGGSVTNAHDTVAGVTVSDCDYSVAYSPDLCVDGSPCYGEAVGSGKVYLATVPMADVMGGITGGEAYPYDQNAAWFSGEGWVNYSMEITQTGTPPEEISGIPVTMTVGGSTKGVGSEAYAAIQGPGVSGKYLPGVAPPLSLAVGSVYTIIIVADCSADAAHSPDCQAVADPVFTFDQAHFPDFNLADYYSFEYSPNLTGAPTPEPSSLVLLGAGLLGLIGLSLKKATA
jgi:hypothetical protein